MQWSEIGAFEMLSHRYVSDNPVLVGHCYASSTDDGSLDGQLFSFACNALTRTHWGEAAMELFKANPRDSRKSGKWRQVVPKAGAAC